MNKKILLFCGIAVFLVSLYQFFSSVNEKNSKEKIILDKIIANEKFIKKYCKEFNVSPRVYVSIIYSELLNNLDFYDEFDEVRAKIGFDPSVGFSQIRISTAYWLETNFTDAIKTPKSKNRQDLINKPLDDESNVLYSVFYTKCIQDTLKRKNYGDIGSVASYYGRGIDFGKEIKPTRYINTIGEIATTFYFSDILLHSFPR